MRGFENRFDRAVRERATALVGFEQSIAKRGLALPYDDGNECLLAGVFDARWIECAARFCPRPGFAFRLRERTAYSLRSARIRSRARNLESQAFEPARDRERAATEIFRTQRSDGGKLVAASRASDGLRIVASPIQDDKIVSRFPETVFIQKRGSADLIEFFQRGMNRRRITESLQSHE
ncbi:hypothetical protein [Caballeronia sp. ATUFL_F2_KS9A]|uniref:hypothetical protein n=1 Tax=Caballeronia sp. ATUFL_F2_KS9A TaxID=2921777 RepID=UPI0020291B6D|nr:hypothetical protein [Caballeronia sp. ATUFL_F2_KS9A]